MIQNKKKGFSNKRILGQNAKNKQETFLENMEAECLKKSPKSFKLGSTANRISNNKSFN